MLERWPLVRTEVERACTLLIDPSPQNLGQCSMLLSSALSRLSQNPPSRQEALALHVSIRKASRLLGTAANFYEGWQAVLGTLAQDGYTPAGEPAAASLRRVSFRG